MQGYNRINLLGNLTQDPELKYTHAGAARAEFKVAVNRKWRDRDGNLKEEVDFIPIVCFGKSAENCAKYLEKGAPVFIDGRLSIQSYEDKEGGRRWWTQVVANVVNFLPRGERRAQDSGGADEAPDDVPFTDGDGPQNKPGAADW